MGRLHSGEDRLFLWWTGSYGHALTTEQANRRCLRRAQLGWTFTCQMAYSMDPDEITSESESSPWLIVGATESGRVPSSRDLGPDLQC